MDRNIDAQDDPGRPPQTTSVLFTALYSAANIGAFAAFVPVLQMLVPLQAVAIGGGHSAALVSAAALAGAAAASFANILFGALSDRSASRGGRRTWLWSGLAATLLTYPLLWSAGSAIGLVAGVTVFQLAFNSLFAPLVAALTDYVPDRQKGAVASLLGLGYPLGALLGTQAVGRLAGTTGAGYAYTAIIVAALIVPFLWHLRDVKPPASRPRPARAGHWLRSLGHAVFMRVVLGRLLISTAFSLVQGYLLLYLHGAGAGLLSGTPERSFATLTALSTCANIVAAPAIGWWSDRAGHRSAFVCASGVVVACAMVFLALAPDWRWLCCAMAIYGGGAGVFLAVDLALLAQSLPSPHHAGRDLGIANLSNTIPQFLAPAIVLGLAGHGAPDFRLLFLLGGCLAAAGALCVIGIPSRPHARPH